jgi:hypothetical protein
MATDAVMKRAIPVALVGDETQTDRKEINRT